MNPNNAKDALRQLRETRRAWIEKAKEAVKAQTALVKTIRAQIESGPRTVPQIAAATGLDSAQVLLYVSGLRKYGAVVEGPKDGDYFTYALAAPKKTNAQSAGEAP
jgi:hypothetical protein